MCAQAFQISPLIWEQHCLCLVLLLAAAVGMFIIHISSSHPKEVTASKGRPDVTEHIFYPARTARILNIPLPLGSL